MKENLSSCWPTNKYPYSVDPNPVPKSYGSATLLKRRTRLNSNEFGKLETLCEG
jgi:hypothetical protein